VAIHLVSYPKQPGGTSPAEAVKLQNFVKAETAWLQHLVN
jgi:hypothetical protein